MVTTEHVLRRRKAAVLNLPKIRGVDVSFVPLASALGIVLWNVHKPSTHKTNMNQTAPNQPEKIIYVETKKSNGIGTAGFVLSLVSLCCSFFPPVGLLIWFLGFLLSFIGLFQQPRGYAIAGFVISCVLLLPFLFLFGGLAVFAMLAGAAHLNSI